MGLFFLPIALALDVSECFLFSRKELFLGVRRGTVPLTVAPSSTSSFDTTLTLLFHHLHSRSSDCVVSGSCSGICRAVTHTERAPVCLPCSSHFVVLTAGKWKMCSGNPGKHF